MDLVSGDKKKQKQNKIKRHLTKCYYTYNTSKSNSAYIYVQYKIAFSSSLLESIIADLRHTATIKKKRQSAKGTTNTTLKHDDSKRKHKTKYMAHRI